jgi:hypothetical protein
LHITALVTASASWLVLGHQLRVHGRRAKMYPVKDIFRLLLSSYSRQNKLPYGFPTPSPIPLSRLSCRPSRRWPNCMGSHVARHRVEGPVCPSSTGQQQRQENLTSDSTRPQSLLSNARAQVYWKGALKLCGGSQRWAGPLHGGPCLPLSATLEASRGNPSTDRVTCPPVWLQYRGSRIQARAPAGWISQD